MNGRRIKIGRYPLGSHRVDLYVDTGSGDAHFDAEAEAIVVGLDQKNWARTVGILVHEVAEQAAHDLRLRFIHDFDMAEASDGYMFTMNHAQFAELTARVGIFIAQCLSALEAAYKKFRKK